MKNVLVIAYYFPPAGGPAAQRILQLVKNLPEFGWQPTVLTVREGSYPNSDRSLLQTIPPHVNVHRTRAWDPFSWYNRLVTARDEEKEDVPAGSFDDSSVSFLEQMARWVRANIFIPDARVGWWPFAVRKGKRLLETGRFDAIISTGAPHSVHLIGRSLHRATGLPWVADLHDPWTDIGFYDELPHTALAEKIDASLERSVLEEASMVTTVSPTWCSMFEEKGAVHCAVIENGFAGEAYPAGVTPPSGQFVLSYVGRLYASRNPTVVWDALEQLQRQELIPDLRLRFIGTVDASVRREVARRGLDARVEYAGFVPHSQALEELLRSRLLLLVIEEALQDEGMITSKLYEYMASERPILGIGPPNGDAARMLEKVRAGKMFGWEAQSDAVAEFIGRHYDAWTRGTPESGADSQDLQSYTWREQTGRLAGELDEITQTV